MPRRSIFKQIFAPEVTHHIKAIDRKYHGVIQRVIDEQLRYTPNTATRNRKPLEEPAPFGATWEIRCGPGNRFRVFYDVDIQEHAVIVLAIGKKDGNRLFIGKNEFNL